MNTDLDCHPTTEILKGYVQGSLPTGWSVALSAHLELCQNCKQQYQDLESDAAQYWPHDSTDQGTQEFSDLVANIINQPQGDSSDVSVSGESPIAEIHMLDHSFTLPRILAKAANEGLVWKKLSGGINQAKLNIDTETQCEFIYMSPGSQTPMHKHQGNEITLVLDGSFSDASGTYEPADFIVRSGKDEHQPISEEGCLCFAVLDSPLTFTKGIARLFNPVNRYRFRNTVVQKP
jgi:putative transcriptional regulator